MSACGSLNYGHNEDSQKNALLDYIRQDGLAIGLDKHTSAKARFLEAFNERL